MPVDEGLMKQMDDAAAQANAEIEQGIDNLTARDIINWWTKWYLKTGHKRLGRILLAIGKTKSD
jgi:hypothetical protein